jgi:high-affinity iron transporter
MILIYGLVLGLVTFSVSPPQDDPAAALRRLAATATLAAQEYRIGVRDGQVVAQAEVDEAVLFLQEAVRAADGLPVLARDRARGQLDSVLVLVRSLADPEVVSAHVLRLTTSLSETMGIALDLVPSSTPSLARGEEIFEQQCASCHGMAGIGDGLAATGLDPPPADLTDALRLADQAPLDFYRRITIGVAGTAMVPYEDVLDPDERWAVALYAGTLRLPEPAGQVPPHLWRFERTARMSDEAIRRELVTYGSGSVEGAGAIAAVRAHPGPLTDSERTTATLALVGVQIDSAYALAMNSQPDAAGAAVLDAYVTFEGIEPAVRARNPGLAAGLEGAFATFRGAVSAATPPLELRSMKGELSNELGIARQALDQPTSRLELFLQSFLILLREGVEAILIVGALIAFLVKTGAGGRRRDVYIGVVAAVAASLLTAVLIETIFHISTAQQELLEGVTMLVAAAVLFYVSYWLLSKMEMARWNRFVSGKVQLAVAGGSLLALPMVAFLAVYREGFETVLFYKALLVSSDVTGAVLPVVGGMLAAGVVLSLVYLAISRFGVRVPLKPFFGLTGVFLYYMAFVFAGKGVLELQGAGLVNATYLSWAPEIPALGAYRTLEGVVVQSLLLVLFSLGLIWGFVIEPRRLKVTSVLMPDPEPVKLARESRTPLPDLIEGDKNLIRSLDRMDADLAEIRAEIVRIKGQLADRSQAVGP